MHDILYHYILHSGFCCIIYEYIFCYILQTWMYINKLCLTHVAFDVATKINMPFGATLNATSGRLKSYRSGRSRIILRARSILMTLIICSCIIFAVVRSTLLLLHFHLHSLCFRN